MATLINIAYEMPLILLLLHCCVLLLSNEHSAVATQVEHQNVSAPRAGLSCRRSAARSRVISGTNIDGAWNTVRVLSLSLGWAIVTHYRLEQAPQPHDKRCPNEVRVAQIGVFRCPSSCPSFHSMALLFANQPATSFTPLSSLLLSASMARCTCP